MCKGLLQIRRANWEKEKKTHTVNEQKIKSLYPGHDREMQFKPHTNFNPSVNEGQNRSYFSEK